MYSVKARIMTVAAFRYQLTECGNQKKEVEMTKTVNVKGDDKA